MVVIRKSHTILNYISSQHQELLSVLQETADWLAEIHCLPKNTSQELTSQALRASAALHRYRCPRTKAHIQLYLYKSFPLAVCSSNALTSEKKTTQNL